jgi:hypothetical protein
MQSRKRFSYLDNTKNTQPPRSGLVLLPKISKPDNLRGVRHAPTYPVKLQSEVAVTLR